MLQEDETEDAIGSLSHDGRDGESAGPGLARLPVEFLGPFGIGLALTVIAAAALLYLLQFVWLRSNIILDGADIRDGAGGAASNQQTPAKPNGPDLPPF